MSDHATVSDVCRRYFPTVAPEILSGMFYRRQLPGADVACPVIGGRRLIPTSFVATIELALRRAGHLPKREEPNV